jgi:hypothetical protein
VLLDYVLEETLVHGVAHAIGQVMLPLPFLFGLGLLPGEGPDRLLGLLLLRVVHVVDVFQLLEQLPGAFFSTLCLLLLLLLLLLRLVIVLHYNYNES